MSYEFKVGQKVVYIGLPAGWEPCAREVTAAPDVGSIYTIRWVGEMLFGTIPPKPFLSLKIAGHERVFSGTLSFYIDYPFRAECFRPLVSDTQPWLKAILETPPLIVTIKASEVIKSIRIAGY